MQISQQPYPFNDVTDDVTNTPITIDYAHHEIHEWSHYFYTDCLTLASGTSQDYLFTTTTKYNHMSFSFEGAAITTVDVYEWSDKTGTTIQTIFNNYRNSTNTSVNTLHKWTSGWTTDWTKIWCHSAWSSTGASSQVWVSSSQNNEIILKLNTKYIFRITSWTNDNRVNIKLNWYEK